MIRVGDAVVAFGARHRDVVSVRMVALRKPEMLQRD